MPAVVATTRARRWAGLAAGLVLGAVCCAGSGACSSAGDARKPSAVISSSLGAESDLRRLLATWARGSAAERRALEPALIEFRKKYPKDDLARFAEVLLAWTELDRGELHVAELRARAIRTAAGPGTVADVARTVEGAALRRQGRPDQALELLSPLVSKLIDPWASALLNEEIVESALAASRWDRALALMRVWLREAGSDEHATARAQVEKGLEKVPPSALVKMLDKSLELGLASDEEVEMRKLVAQRLALVALRNKDAELAQHLLATAGGLLGEQGDPIAELAAGANRARVEARTVGLVLSLRSDRTRRRGADIADGVAFGLGLPGSAARLVTRDDHGSPDRVEEALSALSADGASIVIAGSDVPEATVAAAFAESHHIPVLLLSPPAKIDPKARFSFVVGVDANDLEKVLTAALASHGATPVTIVEDEPLPRPLPPDVSAVRSCTEIADAWKSAPTGARAPRAAGTGVVLAADPECVRRVLAAAPSGLRFAAGFDMDPLALPIGSLIATAGVYPIGAATPPALRAWLKGHPTPPDWWAALGHDAAVLAWAGVQVLPAQGTEDPAEVEARRAWAGSALASAQAELWTTEARGFANGRVVARTLGARDVNAAPRR